MENTIRELISEEELDILLTALSQYEKKCRTIAKRPIMGYGKVSELTKKEEWLKKADEIEKLTTKIAYEFI